MFKDYRRISLFILIYLIAFMVFKINSFAQSPPAKTVTPQPAAQAPISTPAPTSTGNPPSTTAMPATQQQNQPAVPTPAATAMPAPSYPNPTPEKKSALISKKPFTRMYAVFETSLGTFKARLFHSQAPHTVENFVSLAEGTKAWTDPKTKEDTHRPFYNGLIFHRVIKGFIIQTGDPTGTGKQQGSGKKINDEFHPDLRHNKVGILSMANLGPNTAESQFFITLKPEKTLDDRHAVFGEIVDGLEVVEKINSVPINRANDRPIKPVILNKVTIIRE